MTPPEPTAEHRWLTRLVGTWTFASEPIAGQTMEEMAGTETFRALGALWVQGETVGDGYVNQMTLGFDPATGRFVGTFLASVMTHLWRYDGALDTDGQRLVLESVGPSMSDDGAMVLYRDEIVLLGPDERLLQSSFAAPDGSWTLFMRIRYRRA